MKKTNKVKGKFFTFRIEEDTLNLIDKLGFDNKSQFIRFAIRFTLNRLLSEKEKLPQERVGEKGQRPWLFQR
jgi:Arc/MetJ-type ribon-helix-helix transcriptional regulator